MSANWQPIGKLAARLAGLADNEETRQRANAPGHDRQGKGKAMTTKIQHMTAESSRIFAEVYQAGAQAVTDYTSRSADTGTSGYAMVHFQFDPEDDRTKGCNLPIDAEGRACIGAPCGDYQSVAAKEYVAEAMAEALRFNGIDAHVTSWVD